MSADIVTVLRSHYGALAKRLSRGPDGWHCIGFSAGTWFASRPITVGTLDALTATLEETAADPTLCIIRGRLLPHVDPRRHRRLSNRAEHGDAVTYEAEPRRWIALDFDSVPEPSCATFAADPEEGVEHVLGLGPEPFADASCWWQATASAGIKPGIRCRLWFWLSRPVSEAEAKGWLGRAPVDRSLFSPVLPHYTAPPILETGTPDPVARRSGIRRGLTDIVEVPAELPAVEAIATDPVALDGEELTTTDLAQLAAAVRRSAAARAIWAGERTYGDRSRGHFALAAALARSGCTDPDTLHRVFFAYDRRRGVDTGKILRADYARRTIAKALGAEARP